MPESAAEEMNLQEVDVNSELIKWLQEDFDLAREAADKLEAAVADPKSGISPNVYKNQEALFAFLEAAERGLKEKRLDGLCSKLGILDMAGFESVAKAEALKIIGNRANAAKGFVILVADLDGLGGINDSLGHPAGNEFILGAAEAVKSSIRATDILCRFGGDEFVGLLPVDDQETASNLMEVIRKNKDGTLGPAIIQQIKNNVSEVKTEMLSQYGQRFPADDPNRGKGKFPGQISLGWHYLSAKQFSRRYLDCESPDSKGKSFTECLIVEADEKMYKMKNSIPSPLPGVLPGTASS